ncbi:MAG: type II toxin-antitoxin system HicB family antitoxin [Methyloprofundus sp.]|nr:type II toxin-antitoxin system HicB family antitoxin [Methyloprofundus sp.]
MKINFTHWKDGVFYIGFINQYPDYETQGESLEELKENLIDLWQDLEADKVPYSRKIDTLMVA